MLFGNMLRASTVQVHRSAGEYWMRRKAVREIAAMATLLAVGFLLPSTAVHADDQRRHAVSLVGEPKFPKDFKSFSWTNADAPKGGRVRQFAQGSYDSLNQFPAQGQPAGGLTLIYDLLFARSPDEAATGYGLIAEWVSYPPDFSSATFGLRPIARFSDGQPITPEDVIFSLEALKKASPLYSTYYQHVVKAEKTGPNEVRFVFDVKNNRELPDIISELPILPKHWWDGKTASGDARDIMKSSLEIPVGSGPYKIRAFEPGRSVVYERVKDWWAADLPVAKGQWNFDEIDIVYYRDRIAPFEAFKRGDIDYWAESSAKTWATEYEFDAIKRGAVKKEAISVKRVAAMQAFVMNTRRKVFQDERVRHALNLAFDFEWANKNLFFGQYTRLNSYFDNSELAARGLPEGRELEILTEVKADLPADVFTTEFKAPGDDARRNLAAASKLLAEAGFVNKGGSLVNARGESLGFEFLLNDPAMERIVTPFVQNLQKLGVKASIRNVDSAQYERRVLDFDFDMIFSQFAQSESPGNEQREFFGSSTVNVKGSHNLVGIQNKAIDAIIEKVIFATSRADLVAATRALDRALLWNYYTVPTWYRSTEWIAHWDKFGRPATLPARGVSFLQTWWYDADKAKAAANSSQ